MQVGSQARDAVLLEGLHRRVVGESAEAGGAGGRVVDRALDFTTPRPGLGEQGDPIVVLGRQQIAADPLGGGGGGVPRRAA